MNRKPPSVLPKSRKKPAARPQTGRWKRGKIFLDPLPAWMEEAPGGASLGQQTGGALGARGYNERKAREDRLLLDKEWDWVEEYLKILSQEVRDRDARSADLSKVSQVTPFGGTSAKRDHMGTFRKAMLGGATMTAMGQLSWHIAGDCLNPYPRTLRAPPEMDAWHKVKRGCNLWLDILSRCRECDNCLRHRATMWAARAESEWLLTPGRTWKGTITIAPQFVLKYELAGMSSIDSRLREGEELSSVRFAVVYEQASKDITLALKRWRKRLKKPFKYLLVAEAHKSGLPHFHMLLHERNANQQIRHAELKALWRQGFTDWELCKDVAGATYLCKYLSKSLLGRVRPSQQYGKVPLDAARQLAQHVVGAREIPPDPYSGSM